MVPEALAGLQPKYWCKHCKTFVRDTKLERTNHEATAKHQGNIKRFLRDLHRGHEREERDKERAKIEVERLNAVVSHSPSSTASVPWKRTQITNVPRQVTPAERKQQLVKLAEMGVAVPEDFRREVAMAGDWETISETPVYQSMKAEDQDVKPGAILSVGVRKRKLEEEQQQETRDIISRQGWGSKQREYPVSATSTGDDLEALLRGTPTIEPKNEMNYSLSAPDFSAEENNTERTALPDMESGSEVKQDLPILEDPIIQRAGDAPIKPENEAPEHAIVFKKRNKFKHKA
ncbi:MAG: hypothetical protein Q9190_004642 [Brigantiaea leucoxantha]